MFNALAHGLRGRSNPQDYLLSRFGGASAAYSLRRLTTGVDNVVRARESVGDTEADFTAQEVSSGSLRHFALQNDADLIRFADQAVAADKRMYFDGDNDFITVTGMTSAADYFGACTIAMTICPFDNTAFQVMACLGGDSYRVAFNGGNWYLNNGTTGVAAPADGGVYDVEIDFDATGAGKEIRVDSSTVWSGTLAAGASPSTTFYVGSYSSGFDFFGLLYDFSLSGSAVKNFAFTGYGNANSDWEDTVGSNDGTVNGSPALFSGQGFDAYVTTLYDQSESLGQPLSRFANRASASDQRMEFDGVNDYVQVDGMTASTDYFGACVIQASVVVVDSATNQILWSLGSNAYRLQIFSGNWYLNGANTSASVDNVNTPQTVAVTFDASGQATDLSINGSSVWTGTAAGSSAATWFRIGQASSLPFNGIIYDFSLSGSSVKNFAFNGYGITDGDWEDQVGSNDGTVNGSPALYQGRNAIQATAASQPQIVADGVVVTDKGGNPSCDYDGTDDFLDIAFAPGAITSCLWLAVANKDVSADNTYVIDFRDADNDGIRMFCEATPRLFGSVGAADPLQAHDTNLDVLTVEYDGVNGTAYVNGAGGTPVASSAQNVAGNGGIGYAPYLGTSHFDGDITEVILYFTDKSSDRAAIEANIAASYGITLA